MSTLTKQQLDELQARLDAGTQGEWTYDIANDFIVSDDDTCIAQTWDKYEQDFSKAKMNRLLIPFLHNLAPGLLQAARDILELQEQNAKLRASLIDMTAIARIKWGNTDSNVNEIMDQADKALNQGKDPA